MNNKLYRWIIKQALKDSKLPEFFNENTMALYQKCPWGNYYEITVKKIESKDISEKFRKNIF